MTNRLSSRQITCLRSGATVSRRGIAWLALLAIVGLLGGCTRAHYRKQADRDVSKAIDEKAHDPRWAIEDFTIKPKKESRFYDPTNPDRPPMPPDDPAAHRLMHCVDGKCGDGCWHCDGDIPWVESPTWFDQLPLNENGELVIDMERSVQLALIHSPTYQRELEDLYLSALDVTFERFRFDVQFFAGNDTFFTAEGPMFSGPRGESSSRLETNTNLEARKLFATGGELVVGLANSIVWEFSGDNSDINTTLLNFSLIQPLLRGGGRARVLERLTIAERTLLANVRQMEQYRQGFYVNVVTGRDAGQGPQRRGGVLGGAGLSGFTGVGAGGFGQVGNVAQAGGAAAAVGTTGGAGAAQAGGYFGLLQDQQQLRNQEATVAALADSLAQLEAAYEAGRIDRLQVDVARQALYNSRSQLMINRANYQAALDRFKLTLGLPPELTLKIEDPLLSPFQLIDPVIPPLQNRLTALQESTGGGIVSLREQEQNLAAAEPETLRRSLALMRNSVESARVVGRQAIGHIPAVRVDVNELQSKLGERVTALERLKQRGYGSGEGTEEALKQNAAANVQGPPAPDASAAAAAAESAEIENVIADLRRLPGQLSRDLQTLAGNLKRSPEELAVLAEELAWLEQNIDARETEEYRSRLNGVLARIPDQLVELSSQVLELSLIQARARAESVTLLPTDLNSEDALLIASKARLDWMNARASLVDTWRLIEFNANDLLSELNFVFSGDVRNEPDNPLDLRAATGRLRVGAQFDAPLTRMAERNNYRQAQIEYQQARRNYYTFIDRVSQALRAGLRSMDLNQANFELRRAAVRVAIDQVELARLRLRQPPAPGAVQTALGATTARDLVAALGDLQNVQNDFLSVWVNNEVERMNLDFNMGTMELDDRGMWIDPRSALGARGLEAIHGGGGLCDAALWSCVANDPPPAPPTGLRAAPSNAVPSQGPRSPDVPSSGVQVNPSGSEERAVPNRQSEPAGSSRNGDSPQPEPMPLPPAALLREYRQSQPPAGSTRVARTATLDGWRSKRAPARRDEDVQPAAFQAIMPAESDDATPVDAGEEPAVLRIKLETADE